ncbi:MAG: GNAT family N-acetyltransferase [Chloroflexi bacterium]|nr:MAG: GNAT family N-acetyltransferase [Chloroflexota bacterium]
MRPARAKALWQPLRRRSPAKDLRASQRRCRARGAASAHPDQAPSRFTFRILVRREDQALLGAVNLSQIFRGGFQNAYLDYWIGAPYARQGYMREGLGLALDHAFKTLRLHRLEANIQPANTASKKLVEGLGFRLEGFSPRYLKIRGRWRDHERWAILKEDWRPTHPR